MKNVSYKDRDWTMYKRYVNLVPSGAIDIVEFGSGYGYFLEACLNMRPGCNVLGLELSDDRIALSLNKNLKVIKHDISQPVDFLDDLCCDFVFSNQVIEHLHTDAQMLMLQEANRILRPGGGY